MRIEFCSALTMVFVVCKLTGAIDWSWWFVFMPVILEVVLFCLLVVVLIALAAWRWG